MDKFSVTLRGEGISVEREVDRETAMAILGSIFATKDVQPTTTPVVTTMPSVSNVAHEPVESPTRQPEEKPISLREYVNEAEPKTNAQTVLLLAQFMSLHENDERFSRDDIKKRFPKAGAGMPKNFTRDFQTALDKGWIAEDPAAKDSFYVTRTGESQLQAGFRGRRN